MAEKQYVELIVEFNRWRKQVERLVFYHISDGRMIRASATGPVDSGFIPSRVKPMNLKWIFTASLLGAQNRTARLVNSSVGADRIW